MRPVLALLLVSALWGGTFVAIKRGLADASPLLFVALRFLLATLAALPLLRSGAALRRALRTGIPLGLVLLGGYTTQTLGLVTTTPARSAFLTALNVTIVPIWAFALFGRRPAPTSLAGLAIALPGLWLVTGAGGPDWTPGELWTLACAVLFALHVVLVARWGATADTGGLLVAQLATTGILALAATPVLERPHLTPTPWLATALASTAVLATAGTTWLQLRFQPRVDPTRAAVIYATEPVFAALFSWGLRVERIDAFACAGGGLIVLGALVSELGGRRAS